MISDKKDYQNIRSDRDIAATLEMLEFILSKSQSELLEYSKEILDSNKKEFKNMKNILNQNPRLAMYMGDNKKIIELINEDLKDKRASSTKPIKEILKPLFWRMEDLGYRPIQQQKFIYDIYAENYYIKARECVDSAMPIASVILQRVTDINVMLNNNKSEETRNYEKEIDYEKKHRCVECLEKH